MILCFSYSISRNLFFCASKILLSAFEISKKNTDKKRAKGKLRGGESVPVVAMGLNPHIYQHDFFRVGSLLWNCLKYVEA
ncbi:MAG: hypothetical protein P8Y80_12570 [Acidobacteriota bacterium]|jgi:hypothetical protein